MRRLLLRLILGFTAFLCLVFATALVWLLAPWEGTIPDLEGLVPAGVEFYVGRRAAPGAAPTLFDTPFARTLAANPVLARWLRNPPWRATEAGAALEALLEESRRLEATYHLDPFQELGASEVGLALRFAGGAPAALLLVRLSWRARALLRALEFPPVRSGLGLPLAAAGDGIFRWDGAGPGVPPLFGARLADVLLLATDRALLQAARERRAGGGRPFLAAALPTGDALRFRLAPAPATRRAWSAALRRGLKDPPASVLWELLDPLGLRELTGVLELSVPARLAATARFYPGRLEPLQEFLAGSAPADLLAEAKPFLAVLPREVMLLLYCHCPPRELGRLVEERLDPETDRLIAETLAATPLRSVTHLLDRWLGPLAPGCLLVFNRQELTAPPTNPPYPGLTLVFRLLDRRLWEEVLHRDLLDFLKEPLGIRDVRYEQPAPGVEFLFYDVGPNPYADVARPCFGRLGDLLVFSTDPEFLRRLGEVYTGERTYGLVATGALQRHREPPASLSGTGTVLGYVDLQESLSWIQAMAPAWAQARSLLAQLERASEQRQVLAAQARGLPHLRTPETREAWVDARMREWQERLQAEIQQRLRETINPLVQGLAAIRSAAFVLRPGGMDRGPALHLELTLELGRP